MHNLRVHVIPALERVNSDVARISEARSRSISTSSDGVLIRGQRVVDRLANKGDFHSKILNHILALTNAVTGVEFGHKGRSNTGAGRRLNRKVEQEVHNDVRILPFTVSDLDIDTD
jgi:hypothetical protein